MFSEYILTLPTTTHRKSCCVCVNSASLCILLAKGFAHPRHLSALILFCRESGSVPRLLVIGCIVVRVSQRLVLTME